MKRILTNYFFIPFINNGKTQLENLGRIHNKKFTTMVFSTLLVVFASYVYTF